MNRRIVDYLYYGFKPYVPANKLESYNTEYLKNGKNNLTFIKSFFPTYVDIEKYHKKPKKKVDVYLFNYFVVDIEVFGLKQTDTFKKFKSTM